MVQDDEYVSISSANLNQRSLDGTRDTELGMGAWQPAYTLATAKHGKQTDGGLQGNPGQTDSVDAGPAEGYMDERGGNYADVNEERDEHRDSQAYSFTAQQNVSSSGRSGSGGHSGQQHSTGVFPGNAAGASRAGAVQQSDSEPSTAGPSMTNQANNLAGRNSQLPHAQASESSQQVTPMPVSVLQVQPPSASWGRAIDSHPIAQDEAATYSPFISSHAKETSVANDRPPDQPAKPKATVSTLSSMPHTDDVPEQMLDHHSQDGMHSPTGSHSNIPQGQPNRGGVKPGRRVAYPKGEVYGYRMALWLEHLGGRYDPVYDQPHSLECVKQINHLAEDNWLQFSGEKDVDMTGHLVTFPIIVESNGNIKPRTEDGQFSDIDNSVMGKSRPIPAMFLN